jgi:hypothetical protein
VAGASEDAAPPIQAPTIDAGSTPAADAAPADSPAAVDQEAVKEAVENIGATPQPDAAAATPEPEPVTEAPVASPEAVPEAADAPAPSASSATSSGSPVVHDKVIKPLEADPKKDINTLLALEAVKEANSKSPVAGTPVIVDDAQAPGASIPTAAPEPTALGANPSPSSVITPVSSGDDDATTDTAAAETETVEPPKITTAATAVTKAPATQEPGTDLSNIAL